MEKKIDVSSSEEKFVEDLLEQHNEIEF